MACNDRPTRCAPSTDCPPTPDPVLPRCDVVLPDGVFTNATIVVEEGCITQVQAGSPLVYTPDVCCPGGGGGGGNDGADGDPGEPGQNATIDIGQVFTLSPGESAYVTNVGTATNAVLNFGIPEGEPGEDADPPSGETNSTAGIVIEDGLVKDLPVSWPPVLTVTGSTDVSGVIINVTKNNADGSVTLSLEGLNTILQLLEQQLEAAGLAIATLQGEVAELTTRLDICCPP